VAEYTTVVGDFPGAQDGFIQALGVWFDLGALLGVTTAPTNWIGLQFVVPLTFDPTLGVPLGAPGFSGMTLSLWTVAGGFGFTAGTLTPYFVPESDPAPYSNALLPGGRNEIAGGTPLVMAGGEGAGIEQQITLDTTVLTPWVGHSDWRGVVSVSLEWTGDPLGRAWAASEVGPLGSPGQVPRLTTTEYGFNTGFHGNYRGRRGRAVHDFKSGLPYLTDEAVADGFLEGVMVHPDSYDPKDPDPTYVPPSGEGTADDEVSNLE
jgi:hypothetical protein